MFKYFFNLDNFYGVTDNDGGGDSNIQKGLWYKIVEQDDSKVLILDVAGIKPEDISIDFTEENYNGYIVIKGETETKYGKFGIDRRFKIPITYVSKDSSFSIENGLLFINIVPQEKKTFKIQQKKLENK